VFAFIEITLIWHEKYTKKPTKRHYRDREYRDILTHDNRYQLFLISPIPNYDHHLFLKCNASHLHRYDTSNLTKMQVALTVDIPLFYHHKVMGFQHSTMICHGNLCQDMLYVTTYCGPYTINVANAMHCSLDPSEELFPNQRGA